MIFLEGYKRLLLNKIYALKQPYYYLIQLLIQIEKKINFIRDLEKSIQTPYYLLIPKFVEETFLEFCKIISKEYNDLIEIEKEIKNCNTIDEFHLSKYKENEFWQYIEDCLYYVYDFTKNLYKFYNEIEIRLNNEDIHRNVRLAYDALRYELNTIIKIEKSRNKAIYRFKNSELLEDSDDFIYHFYTVCGFIENTLSRELGTDVKYIKEIN